MMFSITQEDFEAREAHYTRLFGPMSDSVMHSTDDKDPHIDIYQFPPSESRDFWTLVTGGMSNLRQPGLNEEELHGRAPRAEILMYVSEPNGWMFSVLKGLAEMPFDCDTYLHWWHTVVNGMPMTAKPSLLTNFFFLPPYFESTEVGPLMIDGDAVDLLWMIPITDAERDYKLAHDGRALEMLFEEKGLPQVVDEGRESLV